MYVTSQYNGGKTITAEAIWKISEINFKSERSRYPKAKRVLVVLTDGRSSDHE